jgi:hypothetical protein
MGFWNRRLELTVFSLLGGEPTIHPRLPEFVTLSRRHWPRAHLRIVTNGFFLHHHPTLPQILRSDPNAGLYLSIYHHAEEYQEKLRPILALLAEWVREYGIKAMIYESSKNWTRRYKGFGAAMEPFEDRQPRRSWQRCPAKNCPQLFEGRIWKCGPLAYLKLQDMRHVPGGTREIPAGGALTSGETCAGGWNGRKSVGIRSAQRRVPGAVNQHEFGEPRK